ncbi:MAG: sigma-70 family RNA polymerase sigma factor [Brevundimonas sp.]|uniref:sigma-70 family RNA polymerase sigma factor n=1 Tax=Brevundimonas sp. TaxID=1871086 RepID=UPI00262972CF|nr:sigma-70 family RNA polymerase sigma factor [Brevundimonas sp.]MDI6623446.1 sigma-70 family RNA polymerase sigma factor [Brevundimonas sp.]MDQ7811501.1 sigma-70 family RNA polymerase sigma factor [Brevundimonas sp.]
MSLPRAPLEGDSVPHPDVPVGIVEPADWREAVTARIPALRAFAWSLSRNGADADDLVQETLTKAWTYRDRFEPGTNLRAWLFTILRNSWYSSVAKRSREVADEDGHHAARLSAEGSQEWSVELGALKLALDELPPEHREAIVMVGAAGLSYEEAAEIAGCALGTIKSRVNRARNRLAEAMDMPRGAA